MGGNYHSDPIPHKPDNFVATICDTADSGDMGKEDRKMQVLSVLVDSNLALPPAVIFRNAKLRGATFERNSTDNYLRELLDEGYVQKVGPEKLEDGDLVEVPSSEEGYFIATESGHERLS